MTSLTPDQQRGVLALAERAHQADGVAPLSERFLLGLATGDQTRALAEQDGRVTAYASRLADGSAELVVDPDHRRTGLGSALLAVLRDAGPGLRIWAHGETPAARAFAERHELVRARALHKMSRSLTSADADTEIVFPAGFRLRSFRPGDEEAWLDVNAAAFIDHPEQGRVTRADFDVLAAQPWFDPAGLLLLETGEPAVLAGSHWTKVDPTQLVPGPGGELEPAGEVYVVAVAPAFHGRGLAGPLTAAGLRHLAGLGLRWVVLYVDETNEPAMRTYRRLGFESMLVDGMYLEPFTGN